MRLDHSASLHSHNVPLTAVSRCSNVHVKKRNTTRPKTSGQRSRCWSRHRENNPAPFAGRILTDPNTAAALHRSSRRSVDPVGNPTAHDCGSDHSAECLLPAIAFLTRQTRFEDTFELCLQFDPWQIGELHDNV